MAGPAADPALWPPLRDLPAAVAAAWPWLARAAEVRGRAFVNAEGGDVAGHGSSRAVTRHVANYLAAAELGERLALSGGPVVDVGSGVGGLGAWLADRLGAELHLVDHDPRVRAVAAAAFADAAVHADLTAAPQAALVTAMEVIEHVPPARQAGFVAALFARVAPGGLLVVSTPEETGYLGGWSGYAPHVGPLDADGLTAVLQAGAGVAPTVWRLEGAPFALGRLRRVAEPLVNRAWARLQRRLPRTAGRLVAVTAAADGRPRSAPAVTASVEAVAPEHGTGSGLLGVVQAPATRSQSRNVASP
ncbi:MAG TPA: methyltransferase domain-containing protein [Egibacteraceae bacterium]|nr:methyltransferase domain-containing protein [Egibacteraceae bacterium]